MTAAVDLDRARYGRMRWNTPLSEDHATLLLDRLDIPPGASVLDLGCGWGELLLRAVVAAGRVTPESGATGIGVDTDAAALDRGRTLATDRGLHKQVTFVREAAAKWEEPADSVVCIGASHAFGGTEQALTALAKVVQPGGRLLFGDGCWCKPPTDEAAALFSGDVLALPDVVAHAVAAGWRVMHLSTADQREWDDFEATWRAGRQEWLVANPADSYARAVRDELDAQLVEYVGIYRGVLDFCYLVLSRERIPQHELPPNSSE